MKKLVGIIALTVLMIILLKPAFGQVQHGINWGWNAVTKDTIGSNITVDGYNIYCATAPGGPFTSKTNGSLILGTTYLQTGLTVGVTYYCQITAVKGAAESAKSATGSALFQFPPEAPGQAPSGAIQ